MPHKGQFNIDTVSKSALYTNVDFSQWTVDKNGCRKFLAKCIQCDKEKGYVREACFNKSCKSCAISASMTGKPSPKKGVRTGKPAWNRGLGFDPLQKKLRDRMSRRMRHALSGRNLSKAWVDIFEMVGYSVDELKITLESKFRNGMSWDNIGKWHIDHIVPESYFPYKRIDDVAFARCWSLENLQPLWAKDNIRKSNKLSGGVSFQHQ